MTIVNLLLIPGTGDTASEIFRALRYEKTVRLYASSHGKENKEPDYTPHRMTPVRPLPVIEDTNFSEALKSVLQQGNIDYIIPTTAEARAFFKKEMGFPPVLDTHAIGNVPPTIQGTELVLDCYSNKQHDLIFVGARQRMSDPAQPEAIWQSTPLMPDQKALAAKHAKQHSLTGAWSFQPAINGTAGGITPYFTPEMGLYRALGVNFLLLMLHEARGNKIKALPVTACAKWSEKTKSVSVVLEYENVFLDLDDTLIIQGSINDTAIAFVYHCQAKKIPVYLVTRHYRDPAITLCEFGIAENLFEDIIWIQDGKPKSSFMKNKQMPLFIDDAFSERLAVSSQTDIPCLPPEAIEALFVTL